MVANVPIQMDTIIKIMAQETIIITSETFALSPIWNGHTRQAHSLLRSTTGRKTRKGEIYRPTYFIHRTNQVNQFKPCEKQ